MKNIQTRIFFLILSLDSTDSSSSGIISATTTISSSSSSSGPTMTGYLWKSKDSTSSLGVGSMMMMGGNLGGEFSKYWFSLSPSLASLVYWLDKHEQDIGKYPLGKYELLKCTHVSSQQTQGSGSDCSLEFRVQFHQGQGGHLSLRAATVEAKLNWCDAIKRVSESSAASMCSKCKPKLVVNPMPLQPSPSSASTTSSQQHLQINEDVGVQLNNGQSNELYRRGHF